MADPRAIYQTHLDEVSALLWVDDFDGAVEHYARPFWLELAEGGALLEDTNAIIASLRTFRETLREMRATGYQRICDEAMLSPDGLTITGRHRSFWLSGARRVRQPFESRVTLIREGGQWLNRKMVVDARNIDVKAIEPSALDGRGAT